MQHCAIITCLWTGNLNLLICKPTRNIFKSVYTDNIITINTTCLELSMSPTRFLVRPYSGETMKRNAPLSVMSNIILIIGKTLITRCIFVTLKSTDTFYKRWCLKSLPYSFFTLYGLATRKESLFSQICIPEFYLDWKSTYMSQEIGYMLKYMKCTLQG